MTLEREVAQLQMVSAARDEEVLHTYLELEKIATCEVLRVECVCKGIIAVA